MSLIEISNVSFSYNNKTRKNSVFNLDSINLSIQKQEFISVLGPNGSGKTTLLKLLAGILYPGSGSIKLKDKEFNRYNRKELSKIIAYVPQTVQSVFPFSVYEIVMMGRTPYLNVLGFENNNDRKIVNEALELMEISHLKNNGINEISGGEAQRAFIARAIAQNPEIILLDEPSTHLDIKHQLSTFNLIKRLNLEKNLTVIVILHDLNIAGHYSNRIVLMKSGSIYKDESVLIALTEDNIKKVFDVNTDIQINVQNNSVNVLIKPDK